MKLKEIARRAGVSTATVSLVLNNKRGVGDETRERISQLLYDNGYKINYQTDGAEQKNIRFLKYSTHSHLVDGNPGFVNAIIDSVEKQCRKLGYNLVMTVFGKNNINEIFEFVRANPLDGIILLATEIEREDIAYLRSISAPIVVVDNYFELENVSCVDMDNFESTYVAVKHIADLGHRRIGYLYNSLPSANCQARREAYETALGLLSLPFDPSIVYLVHPTMPEAYKSVLALLQKGVRFPSALLATNDSIAIGSMKAFKEFGLRVPEDISIIGFDDISYSAIAEPSLTTMNVNCRDIGYWAVRLLCDRIDRPKSSVVKMQIGATLVCRQSTCEYSGNHL